MSAIYKNGIQYTGITDADKMFVNIGQNTLNLQTAVQNLSKNFAPVETNPTTRSHAVGDYITFNGNLYKAKTAIGAGDVLVIGTNVEEISVKEILQRELSAGRDINGSLILTNSTTASGLADNGPALVVGGTRTEPHIQIDFNKIMAKQSGTTTTTLSINPDGGNVEVGGPTTINNSLNSGNITILRSAPSVLLKNPNNVDIELTINQSSNMGGLYSRGYWNSTTSTYVSDPCWLLRRRNDGKIDIERNIFVRNVSGESAYTRVTQAPTGAAVELHCATNGNHGVFSRGYYDNNNTLHNGSTAESWLIFRDANGDVRIPQTLMLTKSEDIASTAQTGPALVVGGVRTGAHLQLDANEIQARSGTATTAGLTIQNEGGSTTFGGPATFRSTASFGGSVTVNGNIHASAATTGDKYIRATNQNTGVAITLNSNASGTHGIYSNGYGTTANVTTSSSGAILPGSGSTGGAWILYRDTGGNVYMKGRADTAVKLSTARTIAIGNQSHTFDGSGPISYSLASIGAASSDVGTLVSSNSANPSTFSNMTANTYYRIMKNNLSGSGNTSTLHEITIPKQTSWLVIGKIQARASAGNQLETFGLYVGGPQTNTTTFASNVITGDHKITLKTPTDNSTGDRYNSIIVPVVNSSNTDWKVYSVLAVGGSISTTCWSWLYGIRFK